MLKVKRSNSKAAQCAALLLSYKNLIIFFLFASSFTFFFWIAYLSTHPILPSKKTPVILYTNQYRSDLKLVFLRAITSAQSSIFLVIYGLTDSDVLLALQEKIAEGLDVRIFYDPSGSKHLSEVFSPYNAFAIKSSGLMHKKILVIDNKQAFLGSANMTTTSLKMHDNLILGAYSQDLAHFLETSLSTTYSCSVGAHELEVWSLPDMHQETLRRVLAEIQKATHSMKVCMFTFTSKEILQALIRAKERGVQVEVALDHYAAKGTGKKVFDTLKQHGIKTLVSRGGKLLHHKWCLIDNSKLILGSTNWTKGAFSKNDDCVIFLLNLSRDQLHILTKIWNTLDIQYR